MNQKGQTAEYISFIIMVLLLGGAVFFILALPETIGHDWIEQEICIKNGYDELRYISQIGNACIKYEPEPIAHLVDCEGTNMGPLAYFGVTPKDCILLKELVVLE